MRLLLLVVWLMLCCMPVLADKPNILFIMVDDLGKEWIGSYGGEKIETPHIDQLAKDGMSFANAWSMPQCTPTRVTLLTGQYPFRHGWTNHWDVPRWGAGAHFDPTMNPSYPLVLRKAGYKTAAAGKWQIDDFRVEPRAMHEAGFDRWCMWTGYETGVKASRERFWNPYIAMDGKSKTRTGQFGPDVYCDFLVDFIKENCGGPMFVYFPMTLTHGPLTSTPDQPNSKGPDAFPGMVRYMDKLVGRLIQAFDEAGVRDKTYIVFTTDNGTGMGQKNQRQGTVVRAAKMKMNEAGTAMPFIVTGPGIKPGSETDALVDFTDIAPTFTDLAGTQMPDQHVLDGKSFAPLLRGEANDSPRQWILAMGGKPAKLRHGRVVPAQPYDDRVLRDKRFKVWVDTQGKIIRLHDMLQDPWEKTNLLQSAPVTPEHSKAIAKFKAILASFPPEDQAPAYQANPAQPWDLEK
ncbi:MAG: sulfatase-like hydrolase/transferase [Phycisphaeraceae bacterium]